MKYLVAVKMPGRKRPLMYGFTNKKKAKSFMKEAESIGGDCLFGELSKCCQRSLWLSNVEVNK